MNAQHYKQERLNRLQSLKEFMEYADNFLFTLGLKFHITHLTEEDLNAESPHYQSSVDADIGELLIAEGICERHTL